MNERRRTPTLSSEIEYLRQLPALILLDRLPTPMVALDRDGRVAYANPAFAAMLGRTDAASLAGEPLTTMLRNCAEGTAADLLAALRESRGELVEWRHSEGFVVHTLVSGPLLVRTDDPLVLISVTDVTEALWTNANAH